jgi:hypothetical protein
MRLAIPILICMLATSCAPYGSYPPVEETASVTSMTFEPVPTVITTSIEWARNKETGIIAGSQFTFTLPSGSSQKSYEQIEQRMDGVSKGTDTTSSIGIKSVRVRGFDASVDISIPRAGGKQPLLYTITLKSSPFKEWRVTEERRWRFDQKALAESGRAMTSKNGLAEAESE